LGEIYQRQVGINEAVFGVDLSVAEAYGVWRLYGKDITK
jgi:hypothetical protein